MKKTLQSLVLLLVALMVPTTASAAWVQVADGVYQDGSTLCIGSGVTSLGSLQLNPSVIYCYAAIPPACVSNTFTGYGATLHVPTASMVSYFTAQYWYNFTNVLADAIEPQSVTLNSTEVELEIDQQFSLEAAVTPNNATPATVYWSTTNTAIATVNSSGTVTAVAPGECYIRAICVDKQALCHVVVTPKRVTITLDLQEVRLMPNHLMTLTATSSPATTDLAVTSSNNAVAIPRIVNGTIQVVGVSEGIATITVSTADGWCHPATCQVTVYTELGDANCDGYINIGDVTGMIDCILGDENAIASAFNADTNSDGVIGIADVTTLIDYILAGGIWPWDEPLPVTETFTVNGVTFTMVAVDGGTFTMGTTVEQDSDADEWEKPAHQVTLSSYCIGQTEVTQALWQAVMGSNPSYCNGGNFGTNLQRPVEQVSWNDCQTFITKLNQMTGKTFRLPTEAEWEFAARGGKLSQGYKYAGSNTIGDVAWYYDNSSALGSSSPDYGTHTVGTKAPNELGLYDMSGNVLEWCQDWFDWYSSEAQTNPIGPTSGSYRVIRGGGWYNGAWYCRVSSRVSGTPTLTSDILGLRLALDPDNSTKFRVSETVVTVMVGSSQSVEILNGNGSYTISGGEGIITTSINGNSLTVTGVEEGTSTVYLTDTSTGATSVLTVIVQSKETFTVNGVTFTMVAVEGGTFTMGATAEQGSDAYDSEKPAHQVTLSSYCIGQTEVTQALWQAVMGSNPSYFNGGSYGTNLQRPVEYVSWHDCQTFITKLNQLTGKTFRLPTEAEWEFAARGGNLSQGYKYAGSNTIGDVAWYFSNSSSTTHAVATKAPNELGLYDMSGNVWEWCQDWYGSYSSYAQTNPVGPSSGSYRVKRGGSWGNYAGYCRVSIRDNNTPSYTGIGLGLRLAL